MDQLKTLIAGIFTLFALSFVGLVILPAAQVATLEPQVDKDNPLDVYPIGVGSREGRAVYAANGCASCHTQVVLPKSSGGDIDRKWGPRQTVARDYLYEDRVLIGSIRIGPDLSNVGVRHDERAWHYEHLYDPRSIKPASVMPSFSYLFAKRKIVGEKSNDALDLDWIPDGWEVVPKAEAKALVNYLLTLNKTHPLDEAVMEAKPEEEKPEAAPAADGATPAASPAPGEEQEAAADPAPAAAAAPPSASEKLNPASASSPEAAPAATAPPSPGAAATPAASPVAPVKGSTP